MFNRQAEKILYKEKFIRNAINDRDKKSLIYLLQDARGRYFLAWLFDYCKVNKKNYSIFKSRMLINEGKRKIAVNTYNSIKNLVNENKSLKENFNLIELEADIKARSIWRYLRNRLGVKKKLKAAMDYILADANGRWYMARIFEYCHVNAMPIVDIEKTNTFYKVEGERQVAIYIGDFLKKQGREYIIKKQQVLQEYEHYKNHLQDLATIESERNFYK